MLLRVRTSSIHLVNVPLSEPFSLGFGTLHTLPRVILLLEAECSSGLFTGIGEAAIDFPFVHYDAWDIYQALSQTSEQTFDIQKPYADEAFRNKNIQRYPAARAAYNMAIDDIVGKVTHRPIHLLYGSYYDRGQALCSLPYMKNDNSLIAAVDVVIRRGMIPKPKVGRGPGADASTIRTVSRLCDLVVFDFNATMSLDQYSELLLECHEDVRREEHCKIIFEQPTHQELGVDGLVQAKKMSDELQLNITIVADESVVTAQDGVEAAQSGIALNLKIQKVGGYYAAKEIEQAVLDQTGQLPVSFVGGTFPTALGRAYDQHCCASLHSATLPSDGWLPSTHWFTGDKHFIKEEFASDEEQMFLPFSGAGLGATPDWEKITPFALFSPEEAYRALRSGKTSPIKLTLAGDNSYGEVYSLRNDGKSPLWNIREE